MTTSVWECHQEFSISLGNSSATSWSRSLLGAVLRLCWFRHPEQCAAGVLKNGGNSKVRQSKAWGQGVSKNHPPGIKSPQVVWLYCPATLWPWAGILNLFKPGVPNLLKGNNHQQHPTHVRAMMLESDETMEVDDNAYSTEMTDKGSSTEHSD